MKCPACAEDNDAGMQFCIICGYSLAPAPAATTVPQAKKIDEMAASRSTVSPMILICSNCSIADPLNGQFCVYCGGRTMPATAQNAPAQPYGNTPVTGPASVVDTRHLSEEVIRMVPTKAKAQSGAPAIVLIVVAMFLGSAGSAAGVYQFRNEIAKNTLHSIWPGEGLVLFSAAPNADLEIEDSKKKSFIFGKTASDGSLYIQSVSPGTFVLNLSDGKGKSLSQDFVVNVGEPDIIGYPQRAELK